LVKVKDIFHVTMGLFLYLNGGEDLNAVLPESKKPEAV
jgi:hypothetical protein